MALDDAKGDEIADNLKPPPEGSDKTRLLEPDQIGANGNKADDISGKNHSIANSGKFEKLSILTLKRGQQSLPVKRGFWSRVRRIVSLMLFSSISRRIATLNLLALVVLLSSILYLNQFREGLIDGRVESLLIQGRIIAGALAASATINTNSVTIDPEKLIELQVGKKGAASRFNNNEFEYPLDPERVAPLVRNLIKPTQTRARIYVNDGSLLLDSNHLFAGGLIRRSNLPRAGEEIGMIDRIGKTLNRWLQRNDLAVYRELSSGQSYPEVKEALIGGPATVVRMSEQGELIVSVAVPIQRFHKVYGVLLLSTQGGDIDRIVADERVAILRVFLVASIVILILSVILAYTIANPLRKLSEAAVNIRRGINTQVEIPDYSSRQDEVGNLSTSMRLMTQSLYARIEAIERFAADVSHELKNPLTSLRSAVETLPLVRNDEARNKLLGVIQHDVLRLNRLITDISDASRLDADLVREDVAPFDLGKLLQNIVAANSETRRDGREFTLELKLGGTAGKNRVLRVSGHEGRLGQVITNLIENARTFIPEKDGRIDIATSRNGSWVVITVSDNGPGIQVEDKSKIFERFYTDRSNESGFGQNSGLGLSISKQIVEAHGGTIAVSNLQDRENSNGATGACFTVCLPAE